MTGRVYQFLQPEQLHPHRPFPPQCSRARRSLTDGYAYRERPDYLIELVAFGIVVITAILSLANPMATLR